jgi:hypothetical protein
MISPSLTCSSPVSYTRLGFWFVHERAKPRREYWRREKSRRLLLKPGEAETLVVFAKRLFLLAARSFVNRLLAKSTKQARSVTLDK